MITIQNIITADLRASFWTCFLSCDEGLSSVLSTDLTCGCSFSGLFTEENRHLGSGLLATTLHTHILILVKHGYRNTSNSEENIYITSIYIIREKNIYNSVVE